MADCLKDNFYDPFQPKPFYGSTILWNLQMYSVLVSSFHFWIYVVELRHVTQNACPHKYYTFFFLNYTTDEGVNIQQYLLVYPWSPWWNQQWKGCLYNFGLNILWKVKTELGRGRRVLGPPELHEIICSSLYCVLSPCSEPLGKMFFHRKLQFNFASIVWHFCKLPNNGYKMKFLFLWLPIINHSGRENIMLTLLFHVIVLLEDMLFNH